LVIDEAHHSAATKKALAVREKLAPKITIEVSATPLSKAHDSQVKIMAKQAVRDGLLKKKVIINNKVKNDGKLKANEQILTLAVEKHEQNKLGYAKENRGLPLTIIAIPDGKNKDVKAEVLEFLKSKTATTKNGKVAVYMSEDKTEGYDTLNTADSTVEFVLCKQAIATGWDCPRACNMVYFRDSDNIVFNTQLFGRILRMPNQLPFENDDLNYAYVFTTNDEILIDTDEDSEELIFEDNKTKKTEVKVSLSSYLIEKINQDIVVGSNFKKHFNKQFESHGVK